MYLVIFIPCNCVHLCSSSSICDIIVCVCVLCEGIDVCVCVCVVCEGIDVCYD